MKSGLLNTALLVLCFYAGLCLLLYLIQRSFIYYPTPPSRNPIAQDLRIPSGGETLQVWQLNPGQTRGIIYFGGNAEDVAGNTPDFLYAFPEFTVYLVNYRGYGASTGVPTEAALFSDAEAVFDRIKPKHGTVHVIGRSLGSGVAVHLADVREVDRLALVTPYDSITSVAAGAMPLFPVRWLLKDRFDSAGRANRLGNPTLVLMAEHDRVIPRPHSERLVAALPPAIVSAEVISGTDHNTIGAVASYWQSLQSFLVK